MQPYQSNGKWFVLVNGGTMGPFDTEVDAMDTLSAMLEKQELTSFTSTLIGLIVQMYGIQKKILILLDTFAKKKGPGLVAKVMAWNSTHPTEQKPIPASLGDMSDALLGADFSSVPGMDAVGFAQVMATCQKIMTGVSDDDSAKMYSVMPLNSN